jgi:hypothetical protein
MGMKLVRIDSTEENNWVAAAIKDGWIGASDQTVEGEWRWADGTLFWLGTSKGTSVNGLFTAWSGPDPTGAPDRVDCARIDSAGTWIDAFCDNTCPFVCEAY